MKGIIWYDQLLVNHDAADEREIDRESMRDCVRVKSAHAKRRV
jgi:hypothetical protein